MFKKWAFLGVILAVLSGCATLGNDNASERLMWQIATVNLIENSSKVTAAGVIERVEMIRQLTDGGIVVTPDHIVDQVLRELGDIRPTERLLIAEFLNSLQSYVLQYEANEDTAQRLARVLDWVESAARTSGL